MPYYSDELIEEVCAQNDIVDVISGYVSLKKKGSDYFGLCPFHSEKTPSFSVSRKKQMYYCFGCGAGGSALTFLMQYENFTFQEAMRSLAERAGIELPKEGAGASQRRRENRRTALLEINRVAAEYFYRLLKTEQGEGALAYLSGRGLDAETIRHFGLGYSLKYSDDLYQYLKKKSYPDELLKDSGLVTISEAKGGRDKFWDRAMFPIMDVKRHVIGFGGRVMGKGEPKYLNSPETPVFEKSRNLYGMNFARRSGRPGILLCEGYMDVIALHRAGFDNAVASLGTAFTDDHANLIKRYAKQVYLTFDSDEAGIRAALRALPVLKKAGLEAKVVNMEPHKDPDEFIRALGAKEYQHRIDDAENSFLFEVRMLQRDYDLGDPGGKTAFFMDVAERLARFPEPLERESYTESVSRRYNIRSRQLASMVNSAGNRGGIVPEQRTKRSTARPGSQKRSGIPQSQKMLLSWLAEEPALIDIVEEHVGPEDFTEGICRRAAGLLYKQHARGELNMAALIEHFSDVGEQGEAAALFQEKLPTGSDRDRQKAFDETVRRVKKDSLERRSRSLDLPVDGGVQRLIDEKRALEKLHIPIGQERMEK